MARSNETGHGRGGDRQGHRSREEHALAGVEELKRALRERAEIVAQRERELLELRAQLERRLEKAGRRRGGRGDAELAERERKLAEREQELEQAIEAARKREQDADAEHALAEAERDRLEERERAVREVERELAGLRVRLEEERAALRSSGTAHEPETPPQPAEPEQLPPPTPLPPPAEEPELDPAASESGDPPAQHTQRR